MNPFPKCISKDCKIKDKCLRSQESSVQSEANYDKIYLDEDKCSWYIEVINEIKDEEESVDVG